MFSYSLHCSAGDDDELPEVDDCGLVLKFTRLIVAVQFQVLESRSDLAVVPSGDAEENGDDVEEGGQTTDGRPLPA